MMPARTRAIRMPNNRPDKTTEMAVDWRSAGARSAARGSSIIGVTVTIPTKNERISKTIRIFVMARPIVKDAEMVTMQRIS